MNPDRRLYDRWLQSRTLILTTYRGLTYAEALKTAIREWEMQREWEEKECLSR